MANHLIPGLDSPWMNRSRFMGASPSSERLDIIMSFYYDETRETHEKVEEYEEILHNKNDFEFFRHTRVTKATHAFILHIIRQHYTANYRGGMFPIDAQEALDVTLIYLGSKATYREIAELFGLSQHTVHSCVKKIITILCNVAVEFVKWPSVESMPQIESEFRDVAGFPGTVSALDGTHIPIKAPREMQADYINRKQTHSVILLATCDATKKFTYIDVGFPGSAHDNRVFTSSSLYSNFLQHEQTYFPSASYHIVGDAAFSLSRHVMVPYRDTGRLNQFQVRFNKKLSKTRIVIEHAFGFLKGRFRRLQHVNADIDKISNIVIACCVLHNITLNSPEEEAALRREGLLPLEKP